MATHGMPWIRVDTGVGRHVKVKKLSVALKDRNAGWHLVLLWTWVGEFYPTGEIPVGADFIEEAAGWRGKSGHLVSKLVEFGFLEQRSESEFVCHGWDELNGVAYKKMVDDRKRSQEHRQGKKGAKDSAGADSSKENTTTNERTRTQTQTVARPNADGRASDDEGKRVTYERTNVRTYEDPPNPLPGEAAGAAGGGLPSADPDPAGPEVPGSGSEPTAADFDRYVDAVRTKLGWPNLDPRSADLRAFAVMRRKRSLDELLDALDGLGSDAHVRANWKLTQVLSSEGYDRGTRAPSTAPATRPAQTFAPPVGVIPPVITDVRAHLQLPPKRTPEEVRAGRAHIVRPSIMTEPAPTAADAT